MKMKKINATIQLRRDNDFNFEKVKDTFIPASGEVVLVDVANQGLRAKVGDGATPYGQLQYADEDIRNMVQFGYYDNGIFYRDPTKQTISTAMINKIYIDKITSQIYHYDGISYVKINGGNGAVPSATSEQAGIVKLYSTIGQNTDGTMTQKSITDELDLRCKTSIDTDKELLIFTF